MELLSVLEEKIAKLIGLLTQARADNEELRRENQELKAENAKLAEENDQLTVRLHATESGTTDEREETRILVDDLIKNIDALVKNEQAQ